MEFVVSLKRVIAPFCEHLRFKLWVFPRPVSPSSKHTAYYEPRYDGYWGYPVEGISTSKFLTGNVWMDREESASFGDVKRGLVRRMSC